MRDFLKYYATRFYIRMNVYEGFSSDDVSNQELAFKDLFLSFSQHAQS